MSHSILELFEFSPRKDHRDPCYDKVKGDFPLLGAAMVGSYDAKEKKGIKGATLMLFIEDDKMKFTLHNKIAGVTLFGTLPDLVLALEDVETCLREGRYDQKTKRQG